MKRILIILPYVPYPLMRGTFQRVFHLAEQLGRHFTADLFCLAENGEGLDQESVFKPFIDRLHFEPFEHPAWPPLFPERLMEALPTTVKHWWQPAVLDALKQFTEDQHYDMIYFCDLVLWPYVKILFPRHGRRVMDRSRVDWLFQTEELNILELSWKEKLLRRENLWKIGRLEKSAYLEIALEIVCGLDDRSFLEQKLPDVEKIFVLPNGYNPDYFNPENLDVEKEPTPTAIFCGALDYSPNVDCLNWYLQDIHQKIVGEITDFNLLIVGKNPGRRGEDWARIPGVKVIGEVPDVRPWYGKSHLQIVPLRIGGGTRLKIVESMGIKTPVVSTTLGAQGLNLHANHDILLADTPETFAKSVVEMIRNRTLRERITEQGFKRVRETYTWEKLGVTLIEQLEGLST